MPKLKANLLFFISFICFFRLSVELQQYSKKPNIKINKQKSALNFNNSFLDFFSMGNKKLIADILWITTLLESDLSHYKQKDLNSWMYIRFNSIVTLDPLFLEAYQFGGKYLSIIKDDLEGADQIFDKGLKEYPNDYNLIYNAAFLNTIERQDIGKGYKLYKKLSSFKQAPHYIKSLLLKLEYEQGKDLNSIFTILEDNYKKETNPIFQEKIYKELYAIKAEIDLKCLNQKLEKCDLYDYDKRKYILKGDIYYSQKKFLPYKLHTNKKGAL